LSVTRHTPAPARHPRAAAGLDQESRRLLWQCRRGLKELDILLEGFARAVLPGALPEERRAFAELLGLTDPELARYLLGGQTHPKPHLAHLVQRIRALCRSGT
jgi:antitoxin CptB